MTTEIVLPILHLPRPYDTRSLIHTHNPQLLAESVERLMYLRVYDTRDSSPVWTLPVPMLLTHSCTQHPPHAHAHHDHMHSGTLVS
jgi:hypothetical protein